MRPESVRGLASSDVCINNHWIFNEAVSLWSPEWGYHYSYSFRKVGWNVIQAWWNECQVWWNVIEVWWNAIQIWWNAIQIWWNVIQVWWNAIQVWRNDIQVWYNVIQVWHNVIQVWYNVVQYGLVNNKWCVMIYEEMHQLDITLPGIIKWCYLDSCNINISMSLTKHRDLTTFTTSWCIPHYNHLENNTW